MTQEEFSLLSEQEYHNIAREISGHITIRTYVNGNSRDDTYETDEGQADIIKAIAFATLVSYGHRSNADLDSILAMAEFTLHQLIPDANTYDTLYTPIRKAIGQW